LNQKLVPQVSGGMLPQTLQQHPVAILLKDHTVQI
jgi:hypothetical protein